MKYYLEYSHFPNSHLTNRRKRGSRPNSGSNRSSQQAKISDNRRRKPKQNKKATHNMSDFKVQDQSRNTR